MARISVPLASRLPSSLRIEPSSTTVTRILGRLSRPSLLSLALDWLDAGNQALTRPYLRRRTETADEVEDEDEDDFYPPASSLEALQEHYSDLQARKGSKREVLDRLLEGDWRHGLTLYQLAMADLQYLYDHPTSQKWTAFRVVPLKADDGGGGADDAVSASVDKTSLAVPRFHPSTFLRSLQAQLLPDIKVHYNFDRHKLLPLLLLRIFIVDSPYSTALALAPEAGRLATAAVEAARTVYVAFPDASPYVYLSSAQAIEPPAGSTASTTTTTTTPKDARSLRGLVVEALPKALSRPGARCALQPTNMATRNLAALLHWRGAGRSNTAGGGWRIYADETTVESPLSTVLPTPPLSEVEEPQQQTLTPPSSSDSRKRKRAASPAAQQRRRTAAARFGPSAKMGDGLGVERVDIVMQDPFPGGRPDSAEAVEDQPDQPDPRRRTHGGRRSQIHMALAREADEGEEEEEEEMAAAENQQREDGGAAAEWRPRVAFTFHGPHVFAGIRQLVEAGVIDGKAMPGWMTGEEGVTVGAVRHGRIRGHKGSGM